MAEDEEQHGDISKFDVVKLNKLIQSKLKVHEDISNMLYKGSRGDKPLFVLVNNNTQINMERLNNLKEYLLVKELFFRSCNKDKEIDLNIVMNFVYELFMKQEIYSYLVEHDMAFDIRTIEEIQQDNIYEFIMNRPSEIISAL